MREEDKNPPDETIILRFQCHVSVKYVSFGLWHRHLFFIFFYNREIIKIIPFLVLSVLVEKFFHFVIIDYHYVTNLK